MKGELVATVAQAINMVPTPDPNVVLIAQRGGGIMALTLAGTSAGTVKTVMDLTKETTTDGERGLLGLAVAPDGKHLYVSFTDLAGNSAIDEVALTTSSSVDLATRRRVLSVTQPFSNHNGGHIAFGPDGYLYIALGDGGSGGDPMGNGQNTNTLLGKILRIAPAATGNAAYGIPADNPFADGKAGRPEIWIVGVRNPWRFSFDRTTGDLWIGDVGQGAEEEVDLLTRASGGGKGVNLGWNIMEGNKPFSGAAAPAGLTPPTYTYDHTRGCSVTGGYLYRGSAIPQLQGAYIYGDFCESKVRGLLLDGTGKVLDERALGINLPGNSLASFGQDANGELYVLSLSDGKVQRIVAAAPPTTTTVAPTTTTAAPPTTTTGIVGNGQPAVRVVSPAQDEAVTSPVTVKAMANNFIVEAAGLVEPGHGHFHLMVDTDCVGVGEVVPRDEQHIHLGNGESETTLELTPGRHSVCLQAGDGLHRALPVTDRRAFVVVAAAPSTAGRLAAQRVPGA